jgi:hypothetical protein
VTRNRTIALKVGGWIALLPLLFLTAVCLIKRAVWSAVVSGDAGLPAQQALVAHASHLATLWLVGLVTGEIAATIVLFTLLPARLRLFRLIIPVLAVPLLTGAIAYGLIIVGHLR